MTPLGTRGVLNEENTLQEIYHLVQERDSTIREAETTHAKILDADYSAVDINAYVAELQTLSEKEKHLLIRVLNKHAKLFQGGLGILNVPPIHLELQ